MTPEVKAPPRADLPGRPIGAPGASAPEGPARDPLARLRAILFPEREAIRRLEQTLEDPDAVSPIVERALMASVRRDPRPLADALFPVMGPAIRRAISQTLAGMLQSLNQVLEHTVSFKGLAWRWEAIRTGTSFGEVVLRHSLLYRVEQVFLVHRESGLLLAHLTAPSIASQSPDMVAGMLTAIQDFARDSFQVDREEMLETMQVGELTVRLEQGARSLLAAVIRGQAPVEFRTEMQRVLEAVEGEHAAELQKFQGDAAPFARSRPRLESLLLMESRAPGSKTAWRAWLLTAVALGLFAILVVPRVVRGHRWDEYLRQLRDEPGILVTDAVRQDGHYVIRGLRDPLARDPALLLAGSRLEAADVVGRWEPYVALLPPFILQRAARALTPPPSIDLRLSTDTLVATGAATDEWFAHAALLAPALPGVGTFVEERVAPRALPALAKLVAEVENRHILFSRGQAVLDSTATEEASRLAADATRLDSAATSLGLTLQLGLIGSADEVGTPETNAQLSLERADRVRWVIIPHLPTTVGMWTEAARIDSLPAATEEDRARLRAVRFRTDIALPPSSVPAPR